MSKTISLDISREARRARHITALENKSFNDVKSGEFSLLTSTAPRLPKLREIFHAPCNFRRAVCKILETMKFISQQIRHHRHANQYHRAG